MKRGDDVGGVGRGDGLGVGFTITNLGGSEGRPESSTVPTFKNCDGDWVAVRVIEGSHSASPRYGVSGVGRQEVNDRASGSMMVEGRIGQRGTREVLGFD